MPVSRYSGIVTTPLALLPFCTTSEIMGKHGANMASVWDHVKSPPLQQPRKSLQVRVKTRHGQHNLIFLFVMITLDRVRLHQGFWGRRKARSLIVLIEIECTDSMRHQSWLIKSRDYVYWLWQYEVLNIRNRLFGSDKIERENNRPNFGNVQKHEQRQ